MREYLIQSEFSFGDEVCFMGDNAHSDAFGIVVGFQLLKRECFVLVSLGGSDVIPVFDEQLEFREVRKTREILSN